MDDRELLETIRPLIGAEETADDCAKYTLPDGRLLVSSTDMLHETTDFPQGMTEFEMGWMSVAVTLSDIASTGAQPVQVLAAVGVDRPERLYPFMEGASACAKTFGAIIAGGDIDSHCELTAVTTAFGIVRPENYCRRSGARAGDAVCITGVPGRAQAALDGDERFRKYLLTPVPQVREGKRIARSGATAMMDVSDGLALSLYDMAAASGVGFSLTPEQFPLPDAGEKSLRYFLYGGGDFGLLFCMPPEKLSGLDIDFSVIGTVTAAAGVLCGGERVERKGYAHLW
ncbi:MAG: thiamine-phosphate kinase [Methanocorpusculum sp.]|nr:thiamine-phosphate kinase [Methanocorpusculum sp.]